MTELQEALEATMKLRLLETDEDSFCDAVKGAIIIDQLGDYSLQMITYAEGTLFKHTRKPDVTFDYNKDQFPPASVAQVKAYLKKKANS